MSKNFGTGAKAIFRCGIIYIVILNCEIISSMDVTFASAFAKVRTTTISFVLSVFATVRLEQLPPSLDGLS
jgi:hypothetical protein